MISNNIYGCQVNEVIGQCNKKRQECITLSLNIETKSKMADYKFKKYKYLHSKL